MKFIIWYIYLQFKWVYSSTKTAPKNTPINSLIQYQAQPKLQLQLAELALLSISPTQTPYT